MLKLFIFTLSIILPAILWARFISPLSRWEDWVPRKLCSFSQEKWMAKPRLKLRFCKLDHNRGSLWLEKRGLEREPKDIKKEWVMESGRWMLPVGGWWYQWEEERAHKTRGKEKCVFRWYLLGVKREHRACGSSWRRNVRARTSPLNSPIWLQPLVFLR